MFIAYEHVYAMDFGLVERRGRAAHPSVIAWAIELEKVS
jgi:hypothetical protein